jgi:hypothetical protein
LDCVALIVWAEKCFGIEIPDDDAAQLLTVGQFCRYIANAMAHKGDPRALPYRAISDLVANHLMSNYHAAPHLISEHARFLEDLGLD